MLLNINKIIFYPSPFFFKLPKTSLVNWELLIIVFGWDNSSKIYNLVLISFSSLLLVKKTQSYFSNCKSECTIISLINHILFSSVVNTNLIEPGVCPNLNLMNKLGIISWPSFKNLILSSKGSLNILISISAGASILFFQK